MLNIVPHRALCPPNTCCVLDYKLKFWQILYLNIVSVLKERRQRKKSLLNVHWTLGIGQKLLGDGGGLRYLST